MRAHSDSANPAATSLTTSSAGAPAAAILSAASIRSSCQASPAAPLTAAIAIELVAETGSTNADLLARLEQLDGPLLLIAQHQNAGRGRAGRSWLSAPGAGLTFSLAWKFRSPLHSLMGLPLAVGVALAESMAALGLQVTLKWPNDVLKDGHKLAGILIETRNVADQNRSASTWAVIGIGINLTVPDALEMQIGHAVAAAPQLAQMERHQLMATLLGHLAQALTAFDEAGFSAFSARWNGFDAYQGQSVTITDRGQILHEGRASGVDALGRLLLDGPGGRIAIVSGDVTLRVKQG
ncbi:MAG: BirA family biotin operon repressor/biotin-[acetyl-CoA-carboxylase] ligase [Janthinobacterium sp.]|jgi:BirA family biotin operon repressor/biotin-[acetyl-CoA-carboxylase] ligase